MLMFLLRRLGFAAGTVVLTAFFAYGVIRLLRPELYPGEGLVSGVWADVERALLHLDFGGACMFSGCPSLRRMWTDGIWADLFLLAGGVLVGVVAGVAGGVWCAARPRSRASRALESAAMVFFCTPVYVVGFTLLLLFAPPFGLFQLPWFFDPHSYQPPTHDFWDFARSMLMPWLVVGAPLKRALGQAPGWPPTIDFAALQALAMWGAVLIVALSLLADIAMAWLDPRIRTGGGAPPG